MVNRQRPAESAYEKARYEITWQGWFIVVGMIPWTSALSYGLRTIKRTVLRTLLLSLPVVGSFMALEAILAQRASMIVSVLQMAQVDENRLRDAVLVSAI